jgi:hypothetical protein
MSKLLGEFLRELGYLTEDQIEEGVESQKRTNPRPLLGTLLISMGLVDEEQLAEALALQLGVERWDLETQPPDETLRGVGLSRQKTAYLKDLAARVVAGELPIEELHDLEDEAVLEALVRWRTPRSGRCSTPRPTRSWC